MGAATCRSQGYCQEFPADDGTQVQEMALSFYSYHILLHTLPSRSRLPYLIVFWPCIAIAIILRVVILVLRALETLHESSAFKSPISFLHIGYFTVMAVIETYSAFFLL